MLVGFRVSTGLHGQELGEVGVELPVGDEVTEALKEVAGVFDTGLGQAHAVFGAVDAEELLGLRLKEVAEVFREDHGDAGEIAEGRDDAAGLKLGEKAGGEAGVAPQFNQSHGLLQAEVFDPFPDAFLGDKSFSCFTSDLDGAIFYGLGGLGFWDLVDVGSELGQAPLIMDQFGDLS